MPLLVSGFRDDGLDATLAQMLPDRAGRVRLVSADRVRSRVHGRPQPQPTSRLIIVGALLDFVAPLLVRRTEQIHTDR